MNTETKDISLLPDLCAVVILYNPDSIGLEKIISNIESYSNYIKKTYIIDNSQNENQKIIEHFPNAFYYLNKNHNGIAGAQNIGCEKALEYGFSWCMTMDQDSSIPFSVLKEYLLAFKKYSALDKKIVSFSMKGIRTKETLSLTKIIRLKILSPLKRIILKNAGVQIKFRTEPDISYPEFLVTASSNIISLDVWKKIGKFDETLFIDQVDNDFTIRLTKDGYKSIRFNKIIFEHNIGEQKFSIFSKFHEYYSSFRLFYIFRNHMIMLNRYPDYSWYYKKTLKEFFIDNCIHSFCFIRNLIIFFKAKKAFKQYIMEPNK